MSAEGFSQQPHQHAKPEEATMPQLQEFPESDALLAQHGGRLNTEKLLEYANRTLWSAERYAKTPRDAVTGVLNAEHIHDKRRPLYVKEIRGMFRRRNMPWTNG